MPFQDVSSDTAITILATLLIPAIFTILAEAIKNRGSDKKLRKEQLVSVYLPLVHMLSKDNPATSSEAQELYEKLCSFLYDQRLTLLVPQYIKDEIDIFGMLIGAKHKWFQIQSYKTLHTAVLKEYYYSRKKLGYPQTANRIIEMWHRMRVNPRIWTFNVSWTLTGASLLAVIIRIVLEHQNVIFPAGYDKFFAFFLAIAVVIAYLWAFLVLYQVIYWVLALCYKFKKSCRPHTNDSAGALHNDTHDETNGTKKDDVGSVAGNLKTEVSPCGKNKIKQNKKGKKAKKQKDC